MNSIRSVAAVVVLVVCALLLIFFRSSVGNFFERVHLAARGVFDTSFSYESFLALKRKEMIATSEKEGEGGERINKSWIRAAVYSRYPFNDRGLVVVARGASDNITIGMPVFSKEGVLLGVIKDVHEKQSEVQTVFDPMWKTSVVVGEHNIKAVIQGGSTPRIELLPKDEVIETDSLVRNIAPEFPFHAPIGTIRDITLSSDDAWQSGVLVPYVAASDIDEVFIETAFP